MDQKIIVQKWPDLLVLVRHGRSLFNEERELINRGVIKKHTNELRVTRNADLPLTVQGKQQAEATGRHLKKAYHNFDVIVSSPFKRAEATARIIVKNFPGAKFVVEERIREIEVGIFDGLTNNEVRKAFPHEYERKLKEGKYYYRPAGGESYPDVNLRVWSFLTTLVREYAAQKVLVVSHSVVMLSFRKMLEKLSEAEVMKLNKEDKIKNCGIIAYSYDPRMKPKPKLKLVVWNRVAY